MNADTVPGQDGAASWSGQDCRYSLGFLPKQRVNDCEKYDIELKPAAADTSRIDSRVLVSSTLAYCSLSNWLNCTAEHPIVRLNNRSS